MAVYQRGENWYIDFTFKGQRIRESIRPSKKNAQKVIDKRKTEIVENKYLEGPGPHQISRLRKRVSSMGQGKQENLILCP